MYVDHVLTQRVRGTRTHEKLLSMRLMKPQSSGWHSQVVRNDLSLGLRANGEYGSLQISPLRFCAMVITAVAGRGGDVAKSPFQTWAWSVLT